MRLILTTIFLMITITTVYSEEIIYPPVESMIGQMIIAGFREPEITEDMPIAQSIKSGEVGGVILFDYDIVLRSNRRNIISPAQLTRLISQIKLLSQDMPLFIGIDQEGGIVSRLKEQLGFRASASQQALGTSNNEALTRREYSFSAEQLSRLGINLNFAPVVDLNINPDNPVIARYRRSFSADPQIVVRNAGFALDEFRRQNIIGVIKHFPGHGSSVTDTHLQITDVTETWTDSELIPYNELISSGITDIIMTAHIFNRNLDPDFPATLSRKILAGILREQLNFDGVIITDDMNMRAITDHYGFEEAIALAINAGADIILVGNNLVYERNIAHITYNTILNLFRSGIISEERIRESYRRITAIKRGYLFLTE